MHDPMTQICSFPSYRSQCWMEQRWRIPCFISRFTLFTLWHVDPCRKGFGGLDDTCGWFMRAHHGDKKVLEKITRRFEEDWDRVFKTPKEDHDSDDGEFVEKVYFRGLFKPNGDPHLSVQGIVLNLFFLAAMENFKVDGRSNWKKARRWMQANLFDILIFAENPADSLFDGITRKFEKGCGEEHTARARQERIERMASCIYGWILRQQRPWYLHPRWHVHHWKIQIHLWQLFKRWAFERCDKCGRGFKLGESVCGSWSGEKIWHDRCSNVHVTDKPDPFSHTERI